MSLGFKLCKVCWILTCFLFNSCNLQRMRISPDQHEKGHGKWWWSSRSPEREKRVNICSLVHMVRQHRAPKKGLSKSRKEAVTKEHYPPLPKWGRIHSSETLAKVEWRISWRIRNCRRMYKRCTLRLPLDKKSVIPKSNLDCGEMWSSWSMKRRFNRRTYERLATR